MVQGLGFLSKKSWHTKNIANQEKVWIAEEREKEEKAKTAELAKQIQQEREDDELSRIAGKKNLDRGIGWMYTGYHKDSETAKEDAAKQAEEYLLGKEFAPAGKAVGDLDAAADIHEGVNAVVAAIDDDDGQDRKPAAAYQEDSVAQRNQAFRMRHEDPMFAVSLQALRKEKSLEQRKDLYERAGITVREAGNSSGDKEQKESKKRKKEQKKKKKSKQRYRSDCSDDSYDGRKRRSKHSRHRSTSDATDDDSYDRWRSSSNRHRRKSSRHQDHEDRYYRKNRSRRSRSRSRSYASDDSFHSRTDRDGSSHPKQRSADQSCKSSDREDYLCPDTSSHNHLNMKDSRKSSPSSNSDDRHYKENHESGSHVTDECHEGYGLQGGGTSSRNGRNDLGPNRALLQRKKEERDAERRRIRETTSTRRGMTPAEREAALRAMERDAAAHAATRDRHLHREHEENDDDQPGQRRGASFLREMTQRAHGIN